MQATKELDALLSLIDDPDGEVYLSVCGKLIDYGLPIKPNLEHLWETTPNEEVQGRIESIIHKLHLTELEKELSSWSKGGHQDLMLGAQLIAKYSQPDISFQSSLDTIEKFRKNIWLELNSFLTPLEQAGIFLKILYGHFSFSGNGVNYQKPDEFLINKVIEQKKGNVITNSILYQTLCRQLSVHASIVAVPDLFLVAFYPNDIPNTDFTPDDIHFFVDPSNGFPHSTHDITTHLKKNGLNPKPSHYQPLSNKKIIQILIWEMANCYQSDPANENKWDDLTRLSNFL